MNMLEKIQANLGIFSQSERKVAQIILAIPAEVIHASIALLAKQADVSEPTVNRFCHRMQTKGFPDFKLQLAQSLANGTPYASRDIDENDSVEVYSGKIFESALAGLERVRSSLDTAKVDRACSDDAVMQRMCCLNSTESDVMVLISHTGRTKNLVELAQLAREKAVSVLAITSPNSPLAHEAALTLEVPEDTDIGMPMVSRLAQLTLIDVLATGYILRRDATFRDNLKRIKLTLKESCPDKEELAAVRP